MPAWMHGCVPPSLLLLLDSLQPSALRNEVKRRLLCREVQVKRRQHHHDVGSGTCAIARRTPIMNISPEPTTPPHIAVRIILARGQTSARGKYCREGRNGPRRVRIHALVTKTYI